MCKGVIFWLEVVENGKDFQSFKRVIVLYATGKLDTTMSMYTRNEINNDKP